MWTCDDRISGTVNSKFSAYLPSQGLVIDGSIPTRLYEPSRGKQYPHWADLIVRSAFLSGGSSNSTSCPKRMDESFVERYTLDNVSHKGKTRVVWIQEPFRRKSRSVPWTTSIRLGSRHQGESLEDDLLITRIDSDEAARSTLVEP